MALTARSTGSLTAACIAAAVLALVIGAREGNAQGAPAIDPATLAAAREVVNASGSTRGFDYTVPQVLSQANTMLTQTRPELSKDLQDVFAIITPGLSQMRAELDEEVAKIYATRFTLAELRQLAAFYTSPVGQKLQAELPNIGQALFPMAQAWRDRLSEEAITQIRIEMRKKGHQL